MNGLYLREGKWLTRAELNDYNNQLNKRVSDLEKEDRLEEIKKEIEEELEQIKEAGEELGEIEEEVEEVEDEIPTNFFQLKKYASKRGVDLSVFKSKKDILKELKRIKEK